MRQAIVTKFMGPTNHRGARIRARASAGAIIVPWDHSLNIEQNHTAAAEKFARKYGWSGSWVGGGMPDDNGNCYVLLPTGALQYADEAAFNVPTERE